MHSKRAAAACAVLSCGLAAADADAAEFKVNDDLTFNAGFGLRTSFSRTDFAAPDGVSKSTDFNVENARGFFSGSYANMFKGTFNFETANGATTLLDGITQLEFGPAANFWLGRMLPPTDRANLYGPFFALPWSFPGTAQNYPNIVAGRDNGATYWGKVFDNKLVYAIGAFKGHNKVLGLSGQTDKPAYFGRVSYSFWDAEPAPAYYTGGWYGGSKDILTVGLAGNRQKDGVGLAAAPGDLKIWSADFLLEKKFAGGVPTLEGAYYKYSLGALDCGSGEPGAPACLPGQNVGGQVDGKSYLVTAAWLFPQKLGVGQLQPYARMQEFKRTVSATTAKTYDLGMNYLIRGPNARATLQLTKMTDDRIAAPKDSVKQLTVGVQLMF